MATYSSRVIRTAVLAGCASLLASLAFAVKAQDATYACKVEISGGLKWESGKWKVRRLFEDKFELVMRGEMFTPESLEKVMSGRAATCTVGVRGRISCADAGGVYLLFDPHTSRGGIARLNGTTVESQERRETVSVEAFSCQRG
jgi:hypothetical protein